MRLYVEKIGKNYLVVPYKFGSQKGTTRSFDCSSFTQNVYRQYGITLPGSSKEQSQVGSYIPPN
nr:MULTISPECIES: NlpC/P60 family protein [Paenibacillus]